MMADRMGGSSSLLGRRRHRLAEPIGLLLLWMITAIILWILADYSSFPQSVEASWLAIQLFLLGIIVAVLAARPTTLRRSLSEVKLGPWMAVGFSVVLGLTTWVWRTAPTDRLISVVDANLLVPAGTVAALGLLSFLLGYRATPKGVSQAVDRIDRGLRGRAPAQPSAGSVIALWLLAMCAVGFQVLNGGFGYLSDPSAALSETSSVAALVSAVYRLGTIATFLAAWRHGRDPTLGTRLSLAIIAGSQIGVSLFAAQKETVIIQLIVVFLGIAIWRRTRLLAVILAAFFVLVFVFPFVTQYRNEVVQGSARLSPSAALSTIDFGELVGLAFNTTSKDSAESATYRLTRIGDVAVIMQKTPEVVPFRPAGDIVTAPLLGLVPRSVWPEKPVLDAGYQMSSVYYGLPSSVHTSSALTPYGDLWRHGGLPVVILGMAALGVLVRTVDERSGDPRRDPGVLFLPVLLYGPLVKQETDFMALAASMVGLVFSSIVAARTITILSPPAADPERAVSSERRSEQSTR